MTMDQLGRILFLPCVAGLWFGCLCFLGRCYRSQSPSPRMRFRHSRYCSRDERVRQVLEGA